jgi:hypothetical protein
VPSKAENTKQIDNAARQHQAMQPVSQELVRLQEQTVPLTMSVQRAVADPSRARPADILALQRTAGNRAVTHVIQLFRPSAALPSTALGTGRTSGLRVQPELMVGHVGDMYKRKADRVAEQVMTVPASASEQQLVQRALPEEEEEADGTGEGTGASEVHMDGVVKRGLELAAVVPGKAGVRGNSEEGRLNFPYTECPNQTGLPTPVLRKMEGFFGQDFSEVRVHANSLQAPAVGALAFTQGGQIHFAPGQFDPHTVSGQQMVGHELAHVVQQAQGQVCATIQARGVAINDDPGLEYEAEVMGAQAARGSVGSPRVRPGASAVAYGVEQGQIGSQGEDIRETRATHEMRNAPIQMVRKKANELVELTVEAFDKQRKAEQMDWANEEGFTDQQRKVIWNIIDWGLSGLASIKLDDIVTDAMTDANNLTYMKNYCEAINGKLNGQPTVQLVRLIDLLDIEEQGKWVAKLNAALGGLRVRAVIPKDRFELLISDESVAEKFLQYYKDCHPILETPTGTEIWAFVTLVRDEGANIGDYKGELTDIRNYHKFPKASLDKLKSDKGQTDKPLTLVLQSLYDHNGAFIRHEHVNKVIQNTNIRVYAMEGLNIDQLRNLKAGGFQKLAQDHGMGGKITQVVFAGHGSSKSIQMGGKGTKVAKEKSTGEYKVEPTGSVPIYFDREDYSTFWTEFFEALFKNMAIQGGFQPKVLLRACLTASNEVDTDKLKRTMKDENIIDVDDPSVDPTTDENQDKIRGAIRDHIQKHGSLATVLTGKAAGRAKILGTQASITAGTTGAIKDTGELDIVALTDPKVAAPKIEYVREGKEPVGALKAVIESWAEDRDACFQRMRERRSDPVNTDEEYIIRLLYETILGTYTNDILKANGFVKTARVLAGVAKGSAECRPARLMKDPMVQLHHNAFYPALFTQFANKYAQLVIYQDWMRHDAAKCDDFVNLLGDATFDRNKVKNYLDFTMLDRNANHILGRHGVSLRGRILLALIGFIEHRRDDCKQFLLTQVKNDTVLKDEVKIELGGYSEDQLRQNLGLPVEAAEPKSGASQKNVDITDAYRVEPMRSTTKKMTKSTLTDWAKIKNEPRDTAPTLGSQYLSKNYIIVGEVKTLAGDDTGWYMLRTSDGKVAYMRKRYF